MAEETIPQMRERIESLEKQVKALEKDNGDLSVTNRTLQAREVFRDQGYDPSQAELFVSSRPEADINAESVNEFATAFNLSPIETPGKEGDSTEEEGTTEAQEEGGSSADSGANLGSMSGAGSGAGGGGQQTSTGQRLTRQEWRELHKSDPVAARRAVQEDRVELRADNPLAQRR